MHPSKSLPDPGVAFLHGRWLGRRFHACLACHAGPSAGRRRLSFGCTSCTISQAPDRYHGWPTVALSTRRPAAAWREGAAIVCPLVRCSSCALPTGRPGAGLESSWTAVWMTAMPVFWRPSGLRSQPPSLSGLPAHSGTRERKGAGIGLASGDMSMHARCGISAKLAVDPAFGGWRSTGRPRRPVVNSFHGPIALSNGRLSMPARSLDRSATDRSGVFWDDGRSWQWAAEIPAREGDDPAEYRELQPLRCPTAGWCTSVITTRHMRERPSMRIDRWGAELDQATIGGCLGAAFSFVHRRWPCPDDLWASKALRQPGPAQ